MATKTITGTGKIVTGDFQDEISWVGKTKDGKSVKIILENAINLGSMDWTLAEKDEVVPEITFTACYDDTSDSIAEPWKIEYEDGSTGTGDMILGLGKFFIGTTAIGKTRGGGKFTREPEYREIVCDGDRGPVKDRITIDAVRVTLTLNAMQIIGKLPDLYAGLSESTTTGV